ncbi:MAG: cobyric acid synthase [Methanolinea sp.]|jgi:adenosylcobyric acid synthase|nr:cobyric acid synthase [Methanolinea sp.]
MSLMVLGTSSHAGKSTVVAALCRVLANRGISVAPFKSQNMSLNSYVTSDGCEIGIAQAMQAFAARAEPRAEMNPILLKPKGDATSQVVLMGHPYKDVPARDYYLETGFLLEQALSAARVLEEDYGHLVVEGAGGAAEMNLYSRDIANVLLARALKYPIILVADIERGGVFAQVYGTIKLLPDDIAPLVKGVIINKFRGDPEIFAQGIEILEKISGVPVLGVLPYARIDLPSEDSLSIGEKKSIDHPVRIGIIRLPHISNFCDFEHLEKRARVEYIPLGNPLRDFDCIIIPGTKNTVEDLAQVWISGTADEIRHARNEGIPIIGICGGYQMLGREVVDSGVESCQGIHRGIGILDVVTRFDRYEKKTEQVTLEARPIGPLLSAMGRVSGYEIHMGVTERGAVEEAFRGEGAATPDGLVFGTYLHGLFSNASAVDALLTCLYARRGLCYVPDSGDPDPYEDLAALFSDHVRMDLILPYFE